MVLYIFRARKDDLDRSQPCKNRGCLSVCEHNSHKSQGPFLRFSENMVLHVFRIEKDDLGRSQPCKKFGCRSTCSFFYRNAQKNSFTLQYDDENDRISF